MESDVIDTQGAIRSPVSPQAPVSTSRAKPEQLLTRAVGAFGLRDSADEHIIPGTRCKWNCQCIHVLIETSCAEQALLDGNGTNLVNPRHV